MATRKRMQQLAAVYAISAEELAGFVARERREAAEAQTRLWAQFWVEAQLSVPAEEV